MARKLMLVGQSRAGKTSLVQRLSAQPMSDTKTQAMEYTDLAIDTPGEYLENPRLYSALIVAASDVQVVGLVHNVDSDQSLFSPGFGQVFNRPVIGIVTKTDLARDSDELARAEQYLRQAGANQVFFTSSQDLSGMEPLSQYLN